MTIWLEDTTRLSIYCIYIRLLLMWPMPVKSCRPVLVFKELQKVAVDLGSDAKWRESQLRICSQLKRLSESFPTRSTENKARLCKSPGTWYAFKNRETWHIYTHFASQMLPDMTSFFKSKLARFMKRSPVQNIGSVQECFKCFDKEILSTSSDSILTIHSIRENTVSPSWLCWRGLSTYPFSVTDTVKFPTVTILICPQIQHLRHLEQLKMVPLRILQVLKGRLGFIAVDAVNMASICLSASLGTSSSQKEVTGWKKLGPGGVRSVLSPTLFVAFASCSLVTAVLSLSLDTILNATRAFRLSALWSSKSSICKCNNELPKKKWLQRFGSMDAVCS